MVTATKFTRSEYMKLPEGYPAELVDGTLVKAPSPTWGHQRLVMDIALELRTLAGADRVVVAPMDVFADDENVLQPDVLVTRVPLPRDADDVGIPLLVVEVLSATSRRRDRVEKTRIYLRAGVEEVWLVDPDTRSVELATRDGSRVRTADEAMASGALPGFVLAPGALFSE